MKDVETLIFSRLTGDTGTDSLEDLLGGSGRIAYGFQSADTQAPSIRYWNFTSGPGLLTGDFIRTWEEFYQFDIFSNLHPDINFRLKRLFDGRCFAIPGSFTQAGAASSVWDWEGPDAFDETLEVMSKSIRFRFFVIPTAQDPI